MKIVLNLIAIIFFLLFCHAAFAGEVSTLNKELTLGETILSTGEVIQFQGESYDLFIRSSDFRLEVFGTALENCVILRDQQDNLCLLKEGEGLLLQAGLLGSGPDSSVAQVEVVYSGNGERGRIFKIKITPQE